MGKPIVVEEMSLQAQVVIEPFEKWDLEFVGPINPMYRRREYILVCIDYVTKWIEAKSLYSANGQSVVDFLFEEIFTRFGVPQEIVIDQGTQFTYNLVKSITEQYQIKHRKYSPCHPQANGQVESTNKVIEAILTKTVQLHHKDWVDQFPKALWTYRTT
jgi:transposase InsO family protein